MKLNESSMAAAIMVLASVVADVALAESVGDLLPVSIEFELLANERPARCGLDLGPLGQDETLTRLLDARWYLHDVALLNADGARIPVVMHVNEWQDGKVALIDFEDATADCSHGTPEMNHAVTGVVPAGTYVGLEFSVGVAAPENHSSTELSAPPLDIASMGWSWQAGRKFMKVEFVPEGGVSRSDGSTARFWFIHLGSSGCTGNPLTGEVVDCLASNRIPVRFPSFDISRQRVVLDLNVLLESSFLSSEQGGAVGCMSSPTDPECIPLFTQLGVSLETGLPLAAGAPAFVAQSKP